MKRVISLVFVLLFVGTAAQAADQIKPSVECASAFLMAATYEECQRRCDPPYQTCLNGCANIPEKEEARRKSCVDGCFRGFHGCVARCEKSSSMLDNEQRAATTILASSHCVQLPIRCTSNNDCTCSRCCGQLGEGGPKVCQPSC